MDSLVKVTRADRNLTASSVPPPIVSNQTECLFKLYVNKLNMNVAYCHYS